MRLDRKQQVRHVHSSEPTRGRNVDPLTDEFNMECIIVHICICTYTNQRSNRHHHGRLVQVKILFKNQTQL
jgi:hypothetical protein